VSRDDNIDWTRSNPESASHLSTFVYARAHVIFCLCGGWGVLQFGDNGAERLGCEPVGDYGHRGLYSREEATRIAETINARRKSPSPFAPDRRFPS
jgi:hypothetical protein